MTDDLLSNLDHPATLAICPGAVALCGFARGLATTLLQAIAAIETRAPFRLMVTPGGLRMSVAMTNCGDYGWLSDRRGYRYAATDPETGAAWPAMPGVFRALAGAAAAAAGFAGFAPDACLINRYVQGTKLSLHQDQDEHDFSAPIVSVSLGLPAVFQFGGARRRDRVTRIPLAHGDVVVWGGPARRFYHGVLPLAAGEHPLTGSARFNLTLRKAR